MREEDTVLLFLLEHFADRSRFPLDMMGQILPAFLLQQVIQLVHAVHSWDRNTGIAANISHKTFHKSLFVPGYGIAEYGFKSVVCR